MFQHCNATQLFCSIAMHFDFLEHNIFYIGNFNFFDNGFKVVPMCFNSWEHNVICICNLITFILCVQCSKTLIQTITLLHCSLVL